MQDFLHPAYDVKKSCWQHDTEGPSQWGSSIAKVCIESMIFKMCTAILPCGRPAYPTMKMQVRSAQGTYKLACSSNAPSSLHVNICNRLQYQKPCSPQAQALTLPNSSLNHHRPCLRGNPKHKPEPGKTPCQPPKVSHGALFTMCWALNPPKRQAINPQVTTRQVQVLLWHIP